MKNENNLLKELLAPTLTEIANTIRQKTKKTENIPLENFASEINNIETYDVNNVTVGMNPPAFGEINGNTKTLTGGLIQLEAQPFTGDGIDIKFTKWTDENQQELSTANPYIATVNEDKNITANFIGKFEAGQYWKKTGPDLAAGIGRSHSCKYMELTNTFYIFDPNNQVTYTSTDGVNWDENYKGIAYTAIAMRPSDIEGKEPDKVILQADGHVTYEYYNEEGLIQGTSNITTEEVDAWIDIAYGNNMYIAISKDTRGYIAYSNDKGVTWTLVLRPGNSRGPEYSIVFNNGIFLLGCDTNSWGPFYSKDGITWKQPSYQYMNTNFKNQNIAIVKDKFIIYSTVSSSFYFSTTGMSWSKINFNGVINNYTTNAPQFSYSNGCFAIVDTNFKEKTIICKYTYDIENWAEWKTMVIKEPYTDELYGPYGDRIRLVGAVNSNEDGAIINEPLFVLDGFNAIYYSKNEMIVP